MGVLRLAFRGGRFAVDVCVGRLRWAFAVCAVGGLRGRRFAR